MANKPGTCLEWWPACRGTYLPGGVGKARPMKDFVKEQIKRYLVRDLPKLRLLGITKSLDTDQIEFVQSVLDRLPLTKHAGG